MFLVPRLQSVSVPRQDDTAGEGRHLYAGILTLPGHPTGILVSRAPAKVSTVYTTTAQTERVQEIQAQFQAQETRTQERTRIDRLKIPEISAPILPTLENTGVMLVMGYSSGCISTVGIQLTLVADSDEKGI